MGVMALVQDTAFEDGKVGDYLFLGNMVYTVSRRHIRSRTYAELLKIFLLNSLAIGKCFLD